MHNKAMKIVIVGHDNYGAREIFTRIVKSHPDLEFSLIITTGLYYKNSYFRSIYKMLKEASFKASYIFCLNRFIELLKYKIGENTLLSRAKQMNIPFLMSDDINGFRSQEFIKQFDTDIIISTFTMHVFNQSTINLSRIATIGCHPSILPNYRGLEVFFWALANGETSSGVSVFYLDEKIDAGKVIMQEQFVITNEETVRSIYIKLTEIAGRLLVSSLEKFKRQKKFSHIPTFGKGSYYPLPTRSCYKKFKASGRKWR
jgi:methionyl-tRNA formyltransferase